ncbi:MAG TPA: L,D-transpeptidase [Gemmatimonadaceae bacterium]
MLGRPAAPDRAAGLIAPARRVGTALTALLLTCLTSTAAAQGSDQKVPVRESQMEDSTEVLFKSAADSVEWTRAKAAAERASGLRVVISLRERHVWVMRGSDTLRSARAAVASGMTINFAGRSWTFRTPRGRHTVLRKVRDPVWTPPDWLYAEAAMEHNLELARLDPRRPVRVNDTQRLVVRNGLAGLLNMETGRFAPLPTEEHIVFNGTLYIPPIVSENRRVPGELGRYALDLGDGYLIHGTADPKSIGRAVTHGCIRLGDEDIEWFYRNVPTGTAVHIY